MLLIFRARKGKGWIQQRIISVVENKIKRVFLLSFCLLLFLAFFNFSWADNNGKPQGKPDPSSPAFITYVMQKIDDMYRGASSQGLMTMKVKTKYWQRSITLESWSLGSEYSLVRIIKPKKEKGTATLKVKDNLFIYLNKTGRTLKVTAERMGGSWMGSHFTNDDLVKHTRFSEDYTVKLLFSGLQKEEEIYRFRLIPKPDAPIVWGKIETEVRQHDLQPLRQVFYDEDGKAVRILQFFQHQKLQGRVMPMKMRMTPLDEAHEYTEVFWQKIDFSVKLSREFFRLERLKSKR